MKIRNEKLANKEVVFSVGVKKFDENGIADITPDEFAKDLLSLKGYTAVEQVNTKEDGKPVEKEEEEQSTVKNMDKMTEKQLDEYAKELGVTDYPKSANKATKKAAIGAFLNEQE